MRTLKPNSRGILVPTAPHKPPSITAVPYDRPSPVLPRIDRLRGGATPSIYIQRSQGGIGDVLMTLPTVKAISKKYQTLVTYGTDFNYLDGALPLLLKGNPYIEKVIPWKEAKYEDYDAVLDLTCPCVYHEKPKAPPINRIDLFARHACVPLEDRSIDYYFQPGELDAAKEFLESKNIFKKTIIFLQPFSSTARRDLHPSTLQKVLMQVLSNFRDSVVVMCTHDGDHTKLDWNFSDIIEIRDWNIRRIAAIMHFSKLVLCPDSSILHMAGALGKKTLSLWGPTDPKARINYYANSVGIAPGLNLSCFPCWWDPCRVGNTCWKRMNVDLIAKVCLAMLNNQSLPFHPDIITFNNLRGEGETAYERV